MDEDVIYCVHCYDPINDDLESSIQCTKCEGWVHLLNCTHFSQDDDLENLNFFCKGCQVTQAADVKIIPIMKRPVSDDLPKPSKSSPNNLPKSSKKGQNKRNCNALENDEFKEIKRMKLADKKEAAKEAFGKYFNKNDKQGEFEIHTCLSVECDFQTLSLNQAEKHAIKHEKKKKSKRKKTVQNKYSCDKCDQKFCKKKEYKVHWTQYHAPDERALCTLCGKDFKDNSNLTKHLQTVHVKNAFISCPECTKTFKNTYAMKTHFSSTHIEKSFCCDMCGSTFTTKRNLNLHFKKVHTAGSLDCHCCDKKFKSPYDLNRHLHTKRSIKQRSGNQNVRYQCQYCDRTFQWKRSLPGHIKACHSTNQEMLMCQYCDKPFKYTVTLKRHVREFHKNIENSDTVDGNDNSPNTHSVDSSQVTGHDSSLGSIETEPIIHENSLEIDKCKLSFKSNGLQMKKVEPTMEVHIPGYKLTTPESSNNCTNPGRTEVTFVEENGILQIKKLECGIKENLGDSIVDMDNLQREEISVNIKKVEAGKLGPQREESSFNIKKIGPGREVNSVNMIKQEVGTVDSSVNMKKMVPCREDVSVDLNKLGPGTSDCSIDIKNFDSGRRESSSEMKTLEFDLQDTTVYMKERDSDEEFSVYIKKIDSYTDRMSVGIKKLKSDGDNSGVNMKKLKPHSLENSLDRKIDETKVGGEDSCEFVTEKKSMDVNKLDLAIDINGDAKKLEPDGLDRSVKMQKLEFNRGDDSLGIDELKLDAEDNHVELKRQDTSTWKFIISNLPKSSTQLVLKWIDSLGCKGVGTSIDEEITHIIVGTGTEMKAARTLKYLQAVASGKLIVSHLWVIAAVQDNFIPDAAKFEVSDEETGGGPGPMRSRIARESGKDGMFTGYEILVSTDLQGMTKKCVEELVLKAGGRCVQDVKEFSVSPYIAKILLQDSVNTMDVSDVMRNLFKSNIATVEKYWLMDSLGHWSANPLLPYMIPVVTKEDLISAGFSVPLANIERNDNIFLNQPNEMFSKSNNKIVNLKICNEQNSKMDSIKPKSIASKIIETLINDIFNCEKDKDILIRERDKEANLIVKKDVNYLFNCQYCKEVFMSQAYLLRHIKKTHMEYFHLNEMEEYYKFPCELCDKKFTTKSILKNHIKNLHTQSDELLECKKCGSVFQTKYLLYQHYPCLIKCPNCDQLFNTKKCLERHLISYHKR